MFALRCTQKILSRLPKQPQTLGEPSTTVLGDWYANIVFTRPKHLIICISEKTLLPVVVAAEDIKRLPQRLASTTAEILRTIGVPPNEIEKELEEMKESYFDKTNSRRVIGSLNDFIYHLEHGVGSQQELSIHDRTLRLANMPCGAINYAYPSEATLAAFAVNSTTNQENRAA